MYEQEQVSGMSVVPSFINRRPEDLAENRAKEESFHRTQVNSVPRTLSLSEVTADPDPKICFCWKKSE